MVCKEVITKKIMTERTNNNSMQKKTGKNCIPIPSSDPIHLAYYILKCKRHGGYYDYFLYERILQKGKRVGKYISSFGRDIPEFYKPNLLKGYCEDYLKTMQKGSVDLIIDDPPYGTTALPWDKAPDWKELAILYHTVLNDNGLVYIFGKQPTLIEIYNNFNKLFDFRFELIWNRNNIPWTTNYKPLIVHENIFVFCKKGAVIEDSKFYIDKIMTQGGKRHSFDRSKKSTTQNKYRESFQTKESKRSKLYPKSVLKIESVLNIPPIANTSEYQNYPTQKPEELIRWIILASSRQNDVVLDPHMGSGTTPQSALWLCRKSIGIELYGDAYNIASKRINETVTKLPKKYTVCDVESTDAL